MADQNTFGQQPANLQVKNEQMPEQWAIIVLDRWMQALEKFKIGATHDLMNSFQKEIQKSNGNVDAVIFKFLKYGRFVDMGVGSGTDINGRVLHRRFDRYRDTEGKMTADLARKKKPWYTKTFYREVAKLRGLYQETYGQQLMQIMENQLSGNLTLHP